jgi:hypothetical protein
MNVTLPDAPSSLPSAPTAFYDELRRMLAVVRPPRLSPDGTSVHDFIAEILRGEIEVVTTWRGETAVSVEHFNVDERGERHLLGHTGFLVPARLLFWRPTRTEAERISWR